MTDEVVDDRPAVSLPAAQVEQLSMALMMLVALVHGAGGAARVYLSDMGEAKLDSAELIFDMSDDGQVLTCHLRGDEVSEEPESESGLVLP